MVNFCIYEVLLATANPPFAFPGSMYLTLPAAIAKKWSTESQVIIASPTKLLPEIRYLHVAVI